MHTKSGNSQWVKQKQASILFSRHKSTHETATNSQKRRFLVIHVPLRVPDSVWPVCPREPPPATLVHTCPGESTPPLTAKRNGGGFSDTACHKPQRKQREPRLHSVWPLAASKLLCDNEPHAVTKKPCGYGAKRNPVHARAHHNGKGELRKGKNLRPPYA